MGVVDGLQHGIETGRGVVDPRGDTDARVVRHRRDVVGRVCDPRIGLRGGDRPQRSECPGGHGGQGPLPGVGVLPGTGRGGEHGRQRGSAAVFARCVAGRIEGGSHDEVSCSEPAEDDLPVGPAARGRAPRAPRDATVRTVVVQPFEVRIEPVVDVPDPFGVHRAVRRAGPGREAGGVSPRLRVGIECGREPGERGQAAVDPLAIDGHEELFGNGQPGEVGRQLHGPQSLRCPGGVDGVQRDAQARAGGVDADRSAGVGIVRDGGHRVRRIGEATVRLLRRSSSRPGGGPAAMQPPDHSAPPRRRTRQLERSPHQTTQRSHADRCPDCRSGRPN